MTSRRLLLAGLGALALPAPALAARPLRRLPRAPQPEPGPEPIRAAPFPPGEPRRLKVQFAHTGAWFDGPYTTANGYDLSALMEFSEVCGDWREGRSKRFDPRLLDQIWRLGQELGRPEWTCLSGYRTPRTNAMVGGAGASQHIAARAVDLWVAPPLVAETVDKARGMEAGGVGAYRSWLHLDTADLRFWDKRPHAMRQENDEDEEDGLYGPPAPPAVQAAAPPPPAPARRMLPRGFARLRFR